MGKRLRTLKAKSVRFREYIKKRNIRVLIETLTLQWHFLSIKVPKQARRSDSLLLENIGLIVTTKCTLKCKHCVGFMQYYDVNNAKDIPIADVCRNFDLLMQRVDFIKEISITGGETLLFRELPKLLDHISKYKNKFGIASILTNGTIVPSEEVFLSAAKHNIIFRLSDYGELSVNIEKLVNETKRHRIPLIRRSIPWFNIQQLVDGDTRSYEDVKKLYLTCGTQCNTLINGKLYHCCVLAHGEALCALPPHESNHVDLQDPKVTKKDILYYLSDETIPQGCRNCSGGLNSSSKPIPAALQTKKTVPYKKYI